jgi:hypothetical protein
MRAPNFQSVPQAAGRRETLLRGQSVGRLRWMPHHSGIPEYGKSRFLTRLGRRRVRNDTMLAW